MELIKSGTGKTFPDKKLQLFSSEMRRKYRELKQKRDEQKNGLSKSLKSGKQSRLSKILAVFMLLGQNYCNLGFLTRFWCSFT